MELFSKACQQIDSIHMQDPNKELHEGSEFPAEALYSQRMVSMLETYSAGSDEAIQLAARCQHFKRWEIARDTYPMNKQGYHRWRNELFLHQANEAARVLEKVGYASFFIQQVKELIGKRNLKHSSKAQLLEDVTCLVFFKYYAFGFASKQSDAEKVKSIVRKTLNKMSDKGKQLLTKMEMHTSLREIILEVI